MTPGHGSLRCARAAQAASRACADCMCARAVKMPFSSTLSAAVGATELLRGWNVAHKLARLALSNVADQGIGALAAEDMRWLWVLRNVWETVIVCSNSSKALDLVTRQHVISYARSLALPWDIHTM